VPAKPLTPARVRLRTAPAEGCDHVIPPGRDGWLDTDRREAALVRSTSHID
jgi:hypothetical protein